MLFRSLKIQPVEAASWNNLVATPRRLQAFAAPMSLLAERLSNLLNCPVADGTQIPGAFTFDLQFAQVDNPDSSADPSLFAALQQQLGLKLEPGKLPVEMLVIDHADKVPTAN